ncbi:MAG: cupin domain-containing protein [Halofilum sp. (in: g-proteobacteria)]|nr:cupin domain-containing protein [Halofilum sp. (in: g-proteobacteria)]
MNTPQRMTIANALRALEESARPDNAGLFTHGSMRVEIYRPDGVDLQQPHEQDELYVVISGTGEFVNGDTRQPFEPGEVLFVPAGVEHRFEHFSDDFATWVIFYGPRCGEAG